MTTWVFLRGLTREARHWGDFPELFRGVFADELSVSDILTLDLPGNGHRCMESTPTSVDAIMEACRSSLHDQGISPPYHLMALSLGGLVALAWAARYPEECCAVVMLSASLRPWNPFYERLRPSAWPTLLTMLLADVERREAAILEITSARAGQLQTVLPAWVDYARDCPVSRGNTLRQLYAAARFSAVERPRVPLLVMAGQGDRVVHPRCSQRLASTWGADLALHPSAGHDLPLDDGGWVANEVKAWLARIRVNEKT
jgi:pimeloyl-ACP methyl ester carboxylesterase